MDPTRPVLDIYPSKSSIGSAFSNRQVHIKQNPDITMQNIAIRDNYSAIRNYQARKKQGYPISSNKNFQLQTKFEQLLNEFNKKTQQANYLSSRLQYQESKNESLNKQLQFLRIKNCQLSQTVIQKNQELQFAYKKIQSELRNGSAGRVFNSDGVQKLQNNIRDAININFQMLKDQVTSQITKIRHL